MARQPKPWYRADRKVWCVTIDGKRYNLGREKKAATAQFRELMRQPERARSPVVSTSLVVVIESFLDWVDRNRSHATYEWYRTRLQSFAQTYPSLTVGQLKPYHVEQWAGDPKWSVTTRRNFMRSVKRCLKWAAAQGHIEKSPVAHMEVPSATSREVYVPIDEFERMLGFVVDPGFADLLRVTYETGCRPQESLRLESRHVDLAGRRWVFPPRESKGKSMPRVVYLPETAVRITERLRNNYATGRLFRNVNGRPWTTDAVGCAFDRIQIRMGKEALQKENYSVDEKAVAEFAATLSTHRIVRNQPTAKTRAELLCEARSKLTQRRARHAAPRCSLYALRHSWATNALRQGIDALTVAVLMGHKDPSTLARTYQHLSHDPAHLLRQACRAVV